MDIDIYIYSSIHGSTPKSGKCMYILEHMTSCGRAQRGDTLQVENMNQYQSELYALGQGLKRLNRPCRITIHTFSRTLMSALKNGWYRTWEANGYKTKRGEDIMYPEEWKTVCRYLGSSTITSVVSDAHSNLEWMKFECERRE